MEGKVRKRQTQSCDRCKLKKRKCDGNNPCSNCEKAEAECTMNISQHKRGPKRFHGSEDEGNSFRSNNNPVEVPLAPQPAPADNIFNPPLLTADKSQLDFDYDFAGNFALDPNLMLSEFVKPSQFNPLGAQVNEPIFIDPVVLNYYTELNPKLVVQQDLDLFLADTLREANQGSDLTGPNLVIPELPGISSTFYLHLISMFFTYFHKTNPIIDETSFLENLVPINKHHGMLLSAIYAIGCQYSRSPHLYQTPFYTPQKAFDYFVNRALSLTPAPEVWGSISSDSVEICQASLLLASCDYKAQKSHTWMMTGMAIRLAQKFELHCSVVQHDFFSSYGKIQKFHLACSEVERKRIWWGALMTDLFSCLSTGSSLIINEVEYINTMAVQDSHIDLHSFALASETFNPIPKQVSIRPSKIEKTDKWMPYFSGFPKDTIFGASDFSAESQGVQNFSFFQINHLFTNMQDFAHVVQLSFLTRRAIRLAKSASPPTSIQSDSARLLYQLVPSSLVDIKRLHDTLINWYENLPIEFRLWNSLGPLVSHNPEDIHQQCIKQNQRLSSIAILLNMLYFATMSILHQCNATGDTLKFTSNGTLADIQTQLFHNPASHDEKIFKVSSTMLGGNFTSPDMLRMAYRAQIYLLRHNYGVYMPPSLTIIPPSEMASSSIISTLLIPSAYALLSQRSYLDKLLEKKKQEFSWDITGLEPLEKVLLPVLDNLGQVWTTAYSHADNLRSIIGKLREMMFKNQAFTPTHLNQANPVIVSADVMSSTTLNLPQTISDNISTSGQSFAVPIVPQTEAAAKPEAKSWHDLRNEFEDEFLL